jgi:hypothetical protein
MLTLAEALNAPDRLPDKWLLFPSRSALSTETPCLVADRDELPEDVDLPADATRAGLTAELDVRTVRDIVENLLQQTAVADTALRVRAFAYYVEHDAFIELDVPT